MDASPLTIETIKKRRDFLAANASGHKFVVGTFIMQIAANDKLAQGQARIGYTVTKKMGGAVQRNRIKRRLREAIRATMPKLAKSQHDYVLISRQKALTCEFHELVRDMRFAFTRISAKNPPNV